MVFNIRERYGNDAKKSGNVCADTAVRVCDRWRQRPGSPKVVCIGNRSGGGTKLVRFSPPIEGKNGPKCDNPRFLENGRVFLKGDP